MDSPLDRIWASRQHTLMHLLFVKSRRKTHHTRCTGHDFGSILEMFKSALEKQRDEYTGYRGSQSYGHISRGRQAWHTSYEIKETVCRVAYFR